MNLFLSAWRRKNRHGYSEHRSPPRLENGSSGRQRDHDRSEGKGGGIRNSNSNSKSKSNSNSKSNSTQQHQQQQQQKLSNTYKHSPFERYPQQQQQQQKQQQDQQHPAAASAATAPNSSRSGRAGLAVSILKHLLISARAWWQHLVEHFRQSSGNNRHKKKTNCSFKYLKKHCNVQSCSNPKP